MSRIYFLNGILYTTLLIYTVIIAILLYNDPNYFNAQLINCKMGICSEPIYSYPMKFYGWELWTITPEIVSEQEYYKRTSIMDNYALTAFLVVLHGILWRYNLYEKIRKA